MFALRTLRTTREETVTKSNKSSKNRKDNLLIIVGTGVSTVLKQRITESNKSVENTGEAKGRIFFTIPPSFSCENATSLYTKEAEDTLRRLANQTPSSERKGDRLRWKEPTAF